jgi:hypothetical protein
MPNNASLYANMDLTPSWPRLSNGNNINCWAFGAHPSQSSPRTTKDIKKDYERIVNVVNVFTRIKNFLKRKLGKPNPKQQLTVYDPELPANILSLIEEIKERQAMLPTNEQFNYFINELKASERLPTDDELGRIRGMKKELDELNTMELKLEKMRLGVTGISPEMFGRTQSKTKKRRKSRKRTKSKTKKRKSVKRRKSKRRKSKRKSKK